MIFLENRLKRLVVKYFLRGMTYDVKIKNFMKHYIALAKINLNGRHDQLWGNSSLIYRLSLLAW